MIWWLTTGYGANHIHTILLAISGKHEWAGCCLILSLCVCPEHPDRTVWSSSYPQGVSAVFIPDAQWIALEPWVMSNMDIAGIVLYSEVWVSCSWNSNSKSGFFDYNELEESVPRLTSSTDNWKWVSKLEILKSLQLWQIASEFLRQVCDVQPQQTS